MTADDPQQPLVEPVLCALVAAFLCRVPLQHGDRLRVYLTYAVNESMTYVSGTDIAYIEANSSFTYTGIVR